MADVYGWFLSLCREEQKSPKGGAQSASGNLVGDSKGAGEQERFPHPLPSLPGPLISLAEFGDSEQWAWKGN